MKRIPTLLVIVFLLAGAAAVAQQVPALAAADLRPDTGVITGDVYTNNFFGFSYRVPAQWTGKAIQRSQPGQRFYQLLSALPAATGASIQYMGIQAEDISGASITKTATQFIQTSPLAAPNSAYESLGPIKDVEIGGHHFARADYRTRPTADDGGFTMFQTQLVTVSHNFAVTLSFTTDNQAALDQLAASASSIIFLAPQPAATPIPAAPAPAVAAPAIAVAAPAKPRVAPEVTNGTVVMTFSDDPAPAKPAATTASAPVVQTSASAPEPAKSEPIVQAAAQPVVSNPAPAKVETVAATAPRSKPSAAIPMNNIVASNPEPVTVARNDAPMVNAPAASSAPVATTSATSTPVTPAPEPSAPVNTAAAAEVVSDGGPTTTVAVSGITRVSDNRMRLSEEVLKEYIFSKSPMVYPQLAKQMNVQGSVVMQVVISMEGKVKEVKVVSGAPQLQGTAVDSVRNWRFLPYLDNGRPMEVESQVSIAFKLGGR
jgi:protein TonB